MDNLGSRQALLQPLAQDVLRQVYAYEHHLAGARLARLAGGGLRSANVAADPARHTLVAV